MRRSTARGVSGVLLGTMMMISLASCLPAAGRGRSEREVCVSRVWVADNRDGTYQNPVLCADYSDPDVVRVGDDFYLTASSFNCVPGLPILHSKDLVNWEIIGHAIPRFADARFDTPQHGNGIWAPSIRYHDGWFWVFVGDPDAGILMTKAKDPAGPWTPLHVVKEGKGLIDTCPLWDDDGNTYLVHAWANSRAGINSILTVCRMSPDGTRLLDEGTMVYDGRNGVAPTIEGPKFYQRNGYYYILAPAGGVKQGWQLALRSKNVFGPYEAKRVLEQGSTDINGPHQGAWVELDSGEHWFVHFQDRGAYGRVVHLNPIRWVDDWPLMGKDLDGNGVGEPVATFKKPNVGKAHPITTPVESDEFSSSDLGLQWQWHANPQAGWSSLTARPGWMRLFAIPTPDGATNLWPVPNLLLQKFPAPVFTATAKLDCGDLAVGAKAGLLVMGQSYACLSVEKTSSSLRLTKRTCDDARGGDKETEDGSAVLTAESVLLRVTVADGAVCRFSFSADGQTFATIGKPFTAQPGRWIGAKVGLFCLSGSDPPEDAHADFDWFRIE
ncbi:MAG: glycoside hydrolase 43 family protein [Sedimentisphaerales bacterium]|nr:glycoside hydrolase 43 family protein [Sedimentisphaerales bacterium]